MYRVMLSLHCNQKAAYCLTNSCLTTIDVSPANYKVQTYRVHLATGAR